MELAKGTGDVKRVVVLGGLGTFGRIVAEELRKTDCEVVVASRGPGAALRVDAEDTKSLREGLRAGDLVIDTAGPFYDRTETLVEAAIDIGFDVIDINDDLGYAERVLALKKRIDACEVRVLASASSVSAVSSCVLTLCGFDDPVRLTAFLAPATKYTANRGSALSLIRSLGNPIRVLRGGELTDVVGWSQRRSFSMPPPVGALRGRLFESADSVLLPRVWSSLRDVEMFVDTNTPGLNAVFRMASRSELLKRALVRFLDLGTLASRFFGARAGGLGYEVEDASGAVKRYSILSGSTGHYVPVSPAILAARNILEGRFDERGLVPPNRHTTPEELIAGMRDRGIRFEADE